MLPALLIGLALAQDGGGARVPLLPDAGKGQPVACGPSVSSVAEPFDVAWWWELNQAALLGPPLGAPRLEVELRTRAHDLLRTTLDEASDLGLSEACFTALARSRGFDAERGLLARAEGALARREPPGSGHQDDLRWLWDSAILELGIAGETSALERLTDLLLDEPRGRAVLTLPQVPACQRAKAGYALGLLAERATDDLRARILGALRDAFERTRQGTPEVALACLYAEALVPASDEGEFAARLGHFRAVLGREQNPLLRSHAATTLARLHASGREAWRVATQSDVARALLEGATDSESPPDLRASALLALGHAGTSGLDTTHDRTILAELEACARNEVPLPVRGFARIALARLGASASDEVAPAVLARIAERLGESIRTDARTGVAWAALASGVLARGREARSFAARAELLEALRGRFRVEREARAAGALALALGLFRDLESASAVLQRHSEARDERLRGDCATALALMGAHEAADPLRAALARSQYRPDELARTAEALRRLGDEGAPEILVELLAGARGLAMQAAISMALARTGDPRAVPALAALLEDGSKTRMARSFAACALGLLLDPRPLPWSAALARDVNPFVASPGLHEPTGSGALDRF